MRISENVLAVLDECRTEGQVLFLPPRQLPRPEYEAVNKCLEAMGGKWNRKAKGHTFECDPADLLENAIQTGEVIDSKKALQQFFTPDPLARRVVAMSSIGRDDIALEPSAGRGAIAVHMRAACPKVIVNDIDSRHAKYLRSIGFTAVGQVDFLTVNQDVRFTKIVMNPPFSRQQDVDHVLHAFDILADGGTLVSIVSESPFFRDNAKSKTFRGFLNGTRAEVIDLEPGAFAESGTMVKSRIVKVTK